MTHLIAIDLFLQLFFQVLVEAIDGVGHTKVKLTAMNELIKKDTSRQVDPMVCALLVYQETMWLWQVLMYNLMTWPGRNATQDQ